MNTITVTVRREPYRLTIRPDSGSAISEPAAMASSTSPSWEGSRLNRSRYWGIRDAQVAKANPVAMKAAYVARTPARTVRSVSVEMSVT